MKYSILFLLCISAYANTVDLDQVSESFGHTLFHQLSQEECPFNISKIIQGLQQAQAGKPSPMTEEEYGSALQTIQQDILQKQGETNLKIANEFLEKNALKEEILCVAPGVQYKILEEGVGATVSPESTPVFHYVGTLVNGSTFSSSRHGEPVAISLSQTIPGVQKGMTGMKEGEKRMVYIHPELGYGSQKAGMIPPNSLLIFEIELIQADKTE